MHSHDDLELNVGRSGKGRYLVDGRLCDVEPGTLLRLSPEQAHLLVEESDDFSMWVAVVRSGAMPPVKGDSGFCTQLSPDDAVFLSKLCEELAEAQQMDLFNAGIRFLFWRAGVTLERAGDAVAPTTHSAVMRAARLMKQPERAPDVDAIARHSGMGRSQLSRLFKKQTGFTLVEYRQNMQLECFLFFYGTGETRNVTEAALEAGFGCYAQFYRVFHQHFNCGPRAYYNGIQQ